MKTATASSFDRITFIANGFSGPHRGFDGVEIDDVTRNIQPILAREEETHHRHLDQESVCRLCTAAPIIEVINTLLGEDVMLWASNFFVKDPGDDETPWHQDQNDGAPPAIEPPLNVSVWLAIDDVSETNGCMRFVPRSHLKLVAHDPPKDGQYFGLADTSSFDLATAVSMELKKGKFVVFTDRVLHGAEPNRSDKRRAGLAMRFTTPFVKILRNVDGMMVSGDNRFGLNRMRRPMVEYWK